MNGATFVGIVHREKHRNKTSINWTGYYTGNYQVQEWREGTGDLDPEKWGWQITNQQLMPVKMNMPPAPEDLLRFFRCIYKTSCGTRWVGMYTCMRRV